MSFLNIMRAIALEFPPPEPDRPSGATGVGQWDEDMVAELLDAIKECGEFPSFDYEWTSRRQGWRVWCPGNEPDGWPDGEVHNDPYSDINDSTIVFIEGGWASLSCRHSHCNEDAEHGKKKFRDFLDYYDRYREFIEYPTETRQEYLLHQHECLMDMSYFGVEQDMPLMQFIYEKNGQKIYSNDGKTWFDQHGQRL